LGAVTTTFDDAILDAPRAAGSLSFVLGRGT
jgi:hypothetical protein